MTDPVVDVLIPVHNPRRPIARAVASILNGTMVEARVIVVCHGIDTAEIAAVLDGWAGDPRVVLLEHRDGIPSPAGPLNAGYAAATAEFTALLDSDDEYEPGALDAWLAVQSRDDADVVIQPLRHADGRSTRTPPVRLGRTRRLDGVRDRLAYRTRQHGLVRRTRFPDLAMTPGLRTGEDVVQGAMLWYSGARISLARGTPAYVIHSDGEDRTSASAKPAAESLAFLDAVLDGPFAAGLDAASRESLALKVLRTHVIDVLAISLRTGDPSADLEALGVAVRRLNAFAPSALGILSRREARMAMTLASPSPDVALLAADLAIHTDFRRPSNLLPASMRRVLHRESPLRFLAGVAFAP